MNQLSENSLPEEQSNPFAAPGVAVDESILPAEILLPLARYSTARTGLQLIYYSGATLAAMVVLTLLLDVSMGVSPGGMGYAIYCLAEIVSLVPMVAMFVGLCMTIACPRSNEKLRAIHSVAWLFLAFGLSFVGSFLGGNFFGGLSSTTNPAWSSIGLLLITSILYFASSVSFALLLKQIGRNIQSGRLEKSARSMLIWYLVSFIVGPVFAIVTTFLRFSNMRPGGGATIGPLLELPELAMLAMSMVVLFQFLAMLRTGIKELTVKRHI